MSNLRQRVIRLAYERPEIRPVLLPLLEKTGARVPPHFDPRPRTGVFSSFKLTMGGYQVSTIGGQDYLTLEDYRNPPAGAGSLQDAIGKEVEFHVGPKPDGWNLPQAMITRVVSGPGPTYRSDTPHYWDGGELFTHLASGESFFSVRGREFKMDGEAFDRAVGRTLSERLWDKLEVRGKKVLGGFPDGTRLVDRAEVQLSVHIKRRELDVDGRGADEYSYAIYATFPPSSRR